jgi:hypothetical protein
MTHEQDREDLQHHAYEMETHESGRDITWQGWLAIPRQR